MTKGELTALAEQVCRHLPGWSVAACEYEHLVKIGDGSGRLISLHGTWAGDGRISISGNYPTGPNGYADCYGRRAIAYNESLPRITVAADKSPKAIAGDIQRRLLPQFLAIHAKAVELQQRDQKSANDAKAAGQRLAAAGARLGKFDGGYQTFDIPYNDHGYIRDGRVCGSVCMDLRSIPIDKAEAIIRILANKGGEHGS